MRIDEILQRLDRVRKNGAGKWTARCPAHDDQHPSLGIAEPSDGKILLHCRSGCLFPEIVASLGLSQKDFFPPSNSTHRSRSSLGYTPVEVNSALNLLRIARFDRKKGFQHSDEDCLAITKAVRIVSKARGMRCL